MQWTDRINSHVVHQSIDQVFKELQGSIESASGSKEAEERVQYLNELFSKLKSIISSIDAQLVNPGILNNIHSYIHQGILPQLQAFKQNKNHGHLDNAINYFDNIQGQLAGLLATVDPEGQIGERLRILINTLSQTANQSIIDIQGKSKSLNEQLEATKQSATQLSQDIQSQKQRIDAIVNNIQSQFSSNEEDRQKKITEALSNLSSTTTQTFEKIAEQHKSEIEQIQTKHKDLQAQIEESNAEILRELQSNKEKADQLLSTINTKLLTSSYKNTADIARGDVEKWNRIAILSMLLLVAVACWIIAPSLVGEIHWPSLVGRICITAIGGIPVAYAARQVDKYSELENRNRRFEIELASIDPFIKLLPKDKQDEIKAKLTDRIFGNPDTENKGNKDQKLETTGTILDFAKFAIDKIVKAKIG